MRFGFLLLLAISCQVQENTAQRTALDYFTNVVRSTMSFLLGDTSNARGMRAAQKKYKIQTPISQDMPFPCKTEGFRSPERPTSVHELRPGDFDIIAAMGDSLTAANGAAASRFFHIGVENRGLSWSIGGQGTWREHLTLANILKEFNPNIFGYSLADSATNDRASQFNVAEPGSMSRDMPFMAKVLVKRIRADKRVNFNKDWKMVTLMIGGNDFCEDICYRPSPSKTPEVHRTNMLRTLDYLRDNLPRTLVNLVAGPNIKILIDFKGKKPYCEAMHTIECPCIFGKARISSQKYLTKVMRRWQQIDEEVSLDSRYRKKDDFAVVLQPFVVNLIFPERSTPQGNQTDWSYLSEDCFHFSQKGYARAANALWNNIMEPVGEKSTNWMDTWARFECPTEQSPYVYTWKNSGPKATIKQIDL